MESLFTRFSGLVIKKPIKDDDFVDRLHYFVTVAILFGSAVIIALQEYLGGPIDCWSPKEYPQENYHQHINSYCWTHHLRYPKYTRESSLDTNASIGFFVLSQGKPLFGIGTAFFRWAIVVFIAQIFLFKLPIFLWRRFSTTSDGDLQKIRDLVLAAQQVTGVGPRQLKMDEVVAYFENWVTGRKSYSVRLSGRRCGKLLTCLLCLGKKSGHYLSTLYLLLKVLNLINVFGNFVILAAFLDINYWKYGLVVVNSVLRKGDWQDPYNFPRLLICDFVIEGDDNAKPKTVGTGDDKAKDSNPEVYQLQCTMNLNLLLEKIFVVLWFWLVFLFIITLANLIAWAVKIKPPCSVIYFVKSFARPLKAFSNVEKGFMSAMNGSVDSVGTVKGISKKDFVIDYLKSDGVFVLQMLEINGDRSLVEDIVEHLWNRYRASKRPPLDSSMLEMFRNLEDPLSVTYDQKRYETSHGDDTIKMEYEESELKDGTSSTESKFTTKNNSEVDDVPKHEPSEQV